MNYEWDERKDRLNCINHGISFHEAGAFDWARAVIVDRSRHADGEPRFAGIGPLDDKIHTLIFTMRGDKVRIISLRRSNKQEEKIYEETI